MAVLVLKRQMPIPLAARAVTVDKAVTLSQHSAAVTAATAV
jgi:hypothetical protein